MPSSPLTSAPAAAAGLEGTSTAVFSIAELNRMARSALESALPLLWVGGEISNLTRASSGHLYFTLKDAAAQVRCAMWRNRAQLLAFRPENGMRVEARALVTLYEARGDYQLNVETLRPAGIGSLFEAFNRLKTRLAAEGLFDEAGRRPLPRFPRALGIVTSPQAAALHDVLVTLRRRAPHLPVVLYPAPVQGADAATRLVEAVSQAGRRAAADGIDVLLLVRGGGSIEDLWSFNDEALARALRAGQLPVVCGVGHESDFTIADFAADLRAPTPTSAAELASAGWYAARAELAVIEPRLQRALERRLGELAQRLDRAALRLVHPRERLRRERATLERLGERLHHAAERRLYRARLRTAQAGLRLNAVAPRPSALADRVGALGERLQRAAAQLLAQRHTRVDTLAAHLQHLAPQAVLARGYAIARDEQGRVLRSASAVRPGATVDVQLADGRLDTRVIGRGER
ncbi:exodeoxyribonuclease VII large subunit [Thauera sp.]|uniref:exodeoxyribonuclease VII large subunit n=1 Tax=Thauera sp. TaxID=1905334 RepID=UPI0026332CCD|nr:exodeoxyribonuclease VII large subunit [Thauera sp.]MCK6408261.1 exodeoxyribonuclease VII large subunit [Thauera sp.]